MKTVFITHIKDGELDFGSEYNEIRFKEYLKDNEGKRMRIENEELTRTSNQNRFYWLYLGIIARETGNNAEELHLFLKDKLLPKEKIKINGRKGQYEMLIPKSTTKLKKLEFGEYLEKICRLTEVPIPDPAESGFYVNY